MKKKRMKEINKEENCIQNDSFYVVVVLFVRM